MSLNPVQLPFLACPQCGGTLRYTKEQVLVCLKCRLCYPVDAKGIPQLFVEMAKRLNQEGRMVERDQERMFLVQSGSEAGQNFRLELGTCKVLGRRVEDTTQTQILASHFLVAFDENTKGLIQQYLNRTETPKKENPKRDLSAYQRLNDFVLEDPGVSRLHAMVFCDERGVGILDLVSRNGTFVNGKEVEVYLLNSGDEITLGNTVLKFQIR